MIDLEVLDKDLFAPADTLSLEPKVEPAQAAPVAVVEAQPVVARSTTSPTVSPATLVQIAMDQGADLDRLERLMNMQERWEKREAEKAYNRAFADFKAEEIVIKRGNMRHEGPLAGKTYAGLDDYVQAITAALSRHGLSSSWKPTRDDKDWIEITCILKHVDGHSETASLGGAPDTGPGRNAIQARASTVSYLERGTLKAVCGLSDSGDDDDGNAAGGGQSAASTIPMELLVSARNAANGGWAPFEKYVQSLTAKQRESLRPEYSTLKAVALRADKEKGGRQ